MKRDSTSFELRPWLLAIGIAVAAFCVYGWSPVSPWGGVVGPGIHRKDLAAFITAASLVPFFFLAARRAPIPVSFGITFLLAFASPLWSYLSRGAVKEGAALFFLLLALLLFDRMKRKTGLLFCSGITLATAAVFYPPHLLTFVAFTALLSVERARWAISFLSGGTVVAVLLFLFPDQWPEPARLSPIQFDGSFPEAFAAHLVSPARGLFLYCPYLLAAVFGFIVTPRRTPLDVLFMALLILHLAFSSLSYRWWGSGYGAYHAAQVVPMVALVLASTLGYLERVGGIKAIVLFFLLGAGGIFGIGLNGYGALSEGGWRWNKKFVSIDKAPHRVWSLKDPPFLRGF